MNLGHGVVLWAVFLLVLSLPALAEESNQDSQPVLGPVEVDSEDIFEKPNIRLNGFDFVWENDTLVDTDESYTNGLELNFHFSIDSLHEYLKKNLKVDRSRAKLSFTQTIYTPGEKDSLNPADYDVPFAGVLEAATEILYGWEGDDGRLKTSGKTGLHAIFVGPHSYAEDVQGGVHELLGQDRAAGWPNQIGDQFGIGVSQHFYYELFRDKSNHFSVTPYGGGELGTIRTFGEVGVKLEAAILGTLPDDFPGHAGIDPSMLDPENPLSLTLFFDANGKAFLHNYAIDGKSFIVSDDPNGMGLEHFVGEVRGGIEFSFSLEEGTRFYTTFFLAHRTGTTPEQDGHTFVGMAFHWDF